MINLLSELVRVYRKEKNLISPVVWSCNTTHLAEVVYVNYLAQWWTLISTGGLLLVDSKLRYF